MCSLLFCFIFLFNCLDKGTFVYGNKQDSQKYCELYSPKNFRDKKKEADNWRKEQQKKWENTTTLSAEEIDKINKIEDPRLTPEDRFEGVISGDMNHLLRQTGGGLERRAVLPEFQVRTTEFRKEVAEMDNLILQGHELTEDFVVYKQLALTQLFQFSATENDDLFRNKNTGEISNELLKKIQALTKYPYMGVMKYFGVFDLSQIDDEERSLIQLELTIPKGTKVLFTQEGQMILPRNMSLKMDEIPTAVNSSNKEMVRIQARGNLIDGEYQEQELVTEEKINRVFDDLLDVKNGDQQINPIVYKFHGEFNAWSKIMAEEALRSLTQSYSQELLLPLINYMNEKGGKIIITDIPLPFLDGHEIKATIFESREEIFSKDIVAFGMTFSKNRTISVRTTGPHLTKTLKHEMGHMLDNFLLDKGSLGRTSASDQFEEYYELEKNQMKESDYGRTSVREFWAEIISFLFSDDEKVKQDTLTKFPKSCRFIEEQIAFVKK